jgi:hypothetical protein
MKRNALTWILGLLSVAVRAQSGHFLTGQLAVLRAGDGLVDQHLKQTPIFIDQFDPGRLNTQPSFTVPIPTNGANSFFFNGHASTEGGLTRSADGRLLVFAGYGGVNLLEKPGTPSLLDIARGFCTVAADGALQRFLYQPNDSAEKMNPRGAATDGGNNFWGCGNAGATVFLNPKAGGSAMEFGAVRNTRAVRIINHVLYATLNGADATAIDKEPGIYQFVDKSGTVLPLPRQADATIRLMVPANPAYTKIAGFDLNPEGTIAYMADTAAGIQKYVKSGGAWKLAYNFSIPSNIPAVTNHQAGCFGLAVDFSQAAPVVYATTTEGYGGSVNSNRVVRIVDTNATALVTTVAQATSANIGFRGIDFTPEAGSGGASKLP